MVAPEIQRTRIENRLPVAREGIPFILLGTALTILSIWLGFLSLFVILSLVTAFVTYFFRDPERVPEETGHAVLSPADGRVLKTVSLTDTDNPFGSPCQEVSIFMSLFNVHVNRAVASGVVTDVVYHEGRFFSANLDKASDLNERNGITIETPEGRTLVVVQVAGLVARRIACWVGPGDRLVAGQRFGLIRFGSRLDVYVPEDVRITARAGQRVKAGQSVIGYLA